MAYWVFGLKLNDSLFKNCFLIENQKLSLRLRSQKSFDYKFNNTK